MVHTGKFKGPVEVDGAYMGGKRKNMHNAKRKELTGRGPAGKVPVVGIKDRATNQVSAAVVQNADSATLQGFIRENTQEGVTVYTDEARIYGPLKDQYAHEAVKHSVGEYVRDQAHTNGIESFWAMLKRAHDGTIHKISPKHLARYVAEFEDKHNVREHDTINQMRLLARGMVDQRLKYQVLIA